MTTVALALLLEHQVLMVIKEIVQPNCKNDITSFLSSVVPKFFLCSDMFVHKPVSVFFLLMFQYIVCSFPVMGACSYLFHAVCRLGIFHVYLNMFIFMLLRASSSVILWIIWDMAMTNSEMQLVLSFYCHKYSIWVLEMMCGGKDFPGGCP